ncbi:MAG: hypothetical protein ACC628_17600 [Pirellulaceae bacterium]
MNHVTPELIEREQVLDPQLYCGPLLSLLGDPQAATVAGLGGEVVAGWRGDARGVVAYGPSDIGDMEMILRDEHREPPERESVLSARPGDVLVNKAWPTRAAWITEAVPRHRFDAGFYAIRNLAPADGFWLALSLNQRHLAQCLLRKSGASILPRLRMTALRRFPLPRTPIEADFLSREFGQCLDDRIASTLELHRLRAEVNERVGSLLPDHLDIDEPEADEPPFWHHYFHCADVDDSLVPGHVAVNARQNALRRRADWIRLPTLVQSITQPQNRMGRAGGVFHILRLSDVADDFRVPCFVPSAAEGSRRIVAEPLRENDVLLSMLVTSPRSVFVGRPPEVRIHPADHWQRLRFRETPGAWALILQTPPVLAQLRRLATGRIQQFATPATISQLVLPDFPLEIRQKWDQRLRRWQAHRDERDQRWSKLRRRAFQLLKRTEHRYGPWVEPPAILRVVEVADDTRYL